MCACVSGTHHHTSECICSRIPKETNLRWLEERNLINFADWVSYVEVYLQELTKKRYTFPYVFYCHSFTQHTTTHSATSFFHCSLSCAIRRQASSGKRGWASQITLAMYWLNISFVRPILCLPCLERKRAFLFASLSSGFLGMCPKVFSCRWRH